MSSRKRRWPVAVEGIVANLLLGVLFVWSVYRSPLLELFPTWTEGMLSVAFGLHNVFVCLGILFGGKLCQRLSKRKIFFVFGCLELIGFGGVALLPVSSPGLSFAALVALYTVVAAFGIGVGINVVQSSTLPWFPDHTGLMSGALYMALGLSSFLLAALARTTLPMLGVKLSFASVGLLIFVTVLLLLCDRKAFTLPDTPQCERAEEEAGLCATPREMVKSLTFWLLIIWNGTMRGAGLILLDHAANIAVAFGAMALVGMLISPANGFGSLTLGALLDRLGLKRDILLVSGIMVLAVLFLLAGGRYGITIAIILGLVLGGVAYGGSSSTYAAAIKLVFGEKHFAANFGYSNFSIALGALIATSSGTVLDAFEGHYSSIFVMVALILLPTLFCALMFCMTYPGGKGKDPSSRLPRKERGPDSGR